MTSTGAAPMGLMLQWKDSELEDEIVVKAEMGWR